LAGYGASISSRAKVLRSGETAFEYEREVQPRRKLGRWVSALDELRAGNAAKSSREQLTLIWLFEELRTRGYDGGYDAVRRYAWRWSKAHGATTATAYVSLSFAPGEAYQFDWIHEVVVLRGVTVIVKVAHFRLCHSRIPFARETQEMVFDAHDRAFAFFKGACRRGIYDNMKTAAETVFVGKDRLYNRRFLQLCSNHLVDLVACTPAAGWEKGQVENQVGLGRFFTPRLRFKTYRGVRDRAAEACSLCRPVRRLPCAVLTDGLPAVEAACAEALAEGVHSADVILNVLARRRDLRSRGLRFSPRTHCGCSMSRRPIAPAMTACGGLADGTHRDSRPHGRVEAFRYEERVR
jgi:transposase